MFALVSSVFVIIPFLLVGTFGSMCLRYELVNKIRPVIDTMHGPYKDRFRFWYGARLFLLVSIAVINPAYLVGHGPFFKLLLQLLFVSLFTIVQAYIKPFASNWINMLDIWCMLNVIFLLFINLFGINFAKGSAQVEIMLFLNILSMSITIFFVFGYHVIRFIRRVSPQRSCCNRFKTDDSLFEYLRNRMSTNTSMMRQSSSRRGYVSIDFQTVQNQDRELTDSTDGRDYSNLREPLLDVSPSADEM